MDHPPPYDQFQTAMLSRITGQMSVKRARLRALEQQALDLAHICSSAEAHVNAIQSELITTFMQANGLTEPDEVSSKELSA